MRVRIDSSINNQDIKLSTLQMKLDIIREDTVLAEY